MDSQIDIEDGSPNANANANAHLIHYQSIVDTLYKAALEGVWQDAERLLRSGVNIFHVEITKGGNTALHIAVNAKQTAFVGKLVEYCVESELELENKYGYTAFCNAAVSGVVEIAKVMYQKNKNLPAIRCPNGDTPLKLAILDGNTVMVEYLYKITPIQDLEDEEYMKTLVELIHADMYVTASNILDSDKRIVTSPTIDRKSALRALAKKEFSYNHEDQGRKWEWERLVSILATIPYIPWKYSSLQNRRERYVFAKKLWKQILMMLLDSGISNSSIFHDAAKIGHVEFLSLLSHSYPDLTYRVNKENHSIFHVAVINRQEEVFSLIYQTGVAKNLITQYIDKDGNNILHLAGKLAPPSRLNLASGAALQMQLELQWFKKAVQAVEKIVRPSDVQMKNKERQTPRKLFTKEHEILRDAGEKWMKETATSCMVVSTLIATVVFAAAFTVPGGYKEEKGVPIFLNDGWFTIFVISDALAMFSSTASILTFLSLFTTQYREDDFLISLPGKLMTGLVTLFTSIFFMVLTFTATFFLVCKEENRGILPKFVIAFAGLPICLYTLLNRRLWINLIHSTFFASRSKFKPGKHRLYD